MKRRKAKEEGRNGTLPKRSATIMKNGKMAGGSAAVGDESDHQVLDGQRGAERLKWVNTGPAVLPLMQERFGGKPTPQQAELTARKVEQRDRRLEIKERELALRVWVFKVKEGSVKVKLKKKLRLEPGVRRPRTGRTRSGSGLRSKGKCAGSRPESALRRNKHA